MKIISIFRTRIAVLATGFALLLLLYGGFPDSLQAEPDYARWGRIAVQETIKRYQANVLDYEHIGRTELSSDEAEEQFKLWIKQGTREFGLLVSVRFNPKTNEQLSIHFKELSS